MSSADAPRAGAGRARPAADGGGLPQPAAFAAGSAEACRRALRAVERRFRGRREAAEPCRTTFYDTFDWRLFRAGVALSGSSVDGGLRLDRESLAGALLQRTRVEAAPAFAGDLPPGPLREALAPLVEMRRLLAVVETERRGTCLRVLDVYDKTVARVRVERATARAPGQRRAPRPVPARLTVLPVRGYAEARAELLAFLEGELGLQRDDRGPLERALAAIGARPGVDRSKLRIVLDPRLKAGEAARAVLRDLRRAARANEDGVRRDLDTEFLHDFRVAVRRTRTCLGQLEDVFAPDALRQLGGELVWLTGVTGPTRDADVYLLKLDDYRAELPAAARDHLAPLEAFLRQRRARELGRLVEALDSPRYRALLESWDAFVRDDRGGGAPPQAARPVGEVAGERIRRRYRRVLDRGRRIDDDSPAAALHRLRIQCKKLRYLLEFFRSLYDEGDLRPLVGELKRLQDCLGDFNDLQIQQQQLEQLAREMAEQKLAPVETQLALGRLVAGLESRQARARTKFVKRFRRFAGRENRRRMRRLLDPAIGAGGRERGAS